MAQFNQDASTINLTCELPAGTSKVVIQQSIDGGNATNMDVTDKVNDFADIRFTITYFTA